MLKRDKVPVPLSPGLSSTLGIGIQFFLGLTESLYSHRHFCIPHICCLALGYYICHCHCCFVLYYYCYCFHYLCLYYYCFDSYSARAVVTFFFTTVIFIIVAIKYGATHRTFALICFCLSYFLPLILLYQYCSPFLRLYSSISALLSNS